MRIPDTNLLLFAHDSGSPFHATADEWLTERLSGPESVGFAWVALLGFIRLSTKSTVFTHPLHPSEAMDAIDGWLARPNVTVVEPASRHASVLRSLLEHAGTAGNLTTDAHLATLAIEHGATLASFDADFHRFGELKLEYLG